MPDAPITPASSISYTVRELFERQESKLDEILGHLDNKVDKADLLVVVQRLEKLETARVNETAVASYKKRVWTVVGVVGGIAAPVLGVIAYVIH
jgi:hypothetical protein